MVLESSRSEPDRKAAKALDARTTIAFPRDSISAGSAPPCSFQGPMTRPSMTRTMTNTWSGKSLTWNVLPRRELSGAFIASLTDSSRRASSRGPFAPSSAVPLCSMNMTRSAMNQSPGPIALRISPSDLSPDSLGDSLPDRDGKSPDLSANPGTLFLLRISASPAPVTGGACTGARLSGAASGTLRAPTP